MTVNSQDDAFGKFPLLAFEVFGVVLLTTRKWCILGLLYE